MTTRAIVSTATDPVLGQQTTMGTGHRAGRPHGAGADGNVLLDSVFGVDQVPVVDNHALRPCTPLVPRRRAGATVGVDGSKLCLGTATA